MRARCNEFDHFFRVSYYHQQNKRRALDAAERRDKNSDLAARNGEQEWFVSLKTLAKEEKKREKKSDFGA